MEVIRRHICTKVDFPASHVCLLEDNASTDQHENHEPVNRCKQDTAQGYWHECYTNAPKFSGQGPIKVDYYLYQYQYFFFDPYIGHQRPIKISSPCWCPIWGLYPPRTGASQPQTRHTSIAAVGGEMVIRGWPSETEIRSTVKTCVAGGTGLTYR
jgi:hypothetical protein